MANVLSTPSQKANIGYNGFPMDQCLKFSSTVGELLPVYYDLLYPGDKVTARVKHKTRTMPLDAAAMCSIEEHFDWFAVPLDQIFSLSSQYLLNIKDIHSSVFLPTSEIDMRNLPAFTGETFTKMFEYLREQKDAYFTSARGSRTLYGTGLRLFELLGIPLWDYKNEYDTSDPDNPVLTAAGYPFSMFPFLACAYQKIYFDYFRDSDREQNNPYAYNLDSFFKSGFIDGYSATTSGPLMFTLRYRSLRHDFFTHNFVSPLFAPDGNLSWPLDYEHNGPMNFENLYRNWLSGNEAVSPLSPDAVNVPLDSYGDASPDIGSSPTTVGLLGFYDEANLPASLNVANIRSAFAVNKLLEVTRRAPKHVDAQVLAHFGVDVPKRVAGEVIHLGHSSSTIVIGDVIATAETIGTDDQAGTALGQVGGKGYNSAESSTIKYENHEPCPVVLMCIYSAAPVVDYRVLGVDRLNTYLNRADFFMPEFDNLGMQPMFEFQTRLHIPLGGEPDTRNYNVIGWQYRWLESKLKYNKVCGNLARTLSYWTTYRDDISSSLVSRLVSPFDIDSIMVKQYEFDAREGHAKLDVLADDVHIFDSDPLFHECYFDVKKASKMSSYGLEQL